MRLAIYLALKEIWRNKGRFLLFSLVIALITTLVLFVAALAEGLANANKEYLEKLDAQLLVFQKNVDLVTSTSRIGFSQINDILRVPGVDAAGPIGFSSGAITFGDGRDEMNVSLIGVEAGKPGSPPVLEGRDIIIDRGMQAIVDMNVVKREGVKIGDTITVKTIQGSKEEFYRLEVVGVTDERQYLFAPSIFLPYNTWEQIRPQAATPASMTETVSNVIAVRLKPGENRDAVAQRLEAEVRNIEAVDIKTAYEAQPGYSAQQSTLNTVSGFTLLIGILVIGGFFQIQMLQKIPQVGVLKAIGTSNTSVAGSVVAQIVFVTTFGVLFGTAVAIGLGAAIPSGVPAVFSGASMVTAILTLLAIGPIGGLVSVRLAVSVEPLIALGLSN